MSDYILSCCSTVDLTREFLERRNLSWIPFHYILDGVDRADDLGKTLSYSDFYQKLREGADARTSQVNIGEFLAYFDSLLSTGRDVLHVSLSSGLSGVVSAARCAARIAEERNPGRKVLVVDSLCASSGYGLLMDTLAELRDTGASLQELNDWALTHRLRFHHLFFSTDLTFYVKGGRISRAAGLFGGVLHICPLLDMNREGRLTPREKHRGKKAVIRRIVKRMEELAENGTAYSGKVFISQSDCPEDAREVADLVGATFPNLAGPVEIFSVGTTIGSHTGPGTVALFFRGRERA